MLTRVEGRQVSAHVILGGTFGVFLIPVILVKLFPAQLDTVIEKSTYLVFHNFAEFFSIMVSLAVFSVGWFTFEQSRDRHALFLGTAFLAVGLLDFMHTMSNAAMPAFISPNSTNKSTQFWLAARLFDSSALLASAYIYPENQLRWLSKWALLLSALMVTGLAFVGIVWFPSYLPATAIQGVGLTSLKRFLEFVVIILLFFAGVAYWQRMARTGDRNLVIYLASFVICICSEALFASYKTGFDTYNALGHTYKVVAFYLIYRGVFISSVNRPYLKLSDAIGKLRAETVSRGDLEKEVAERGRAEEALQKVNEELETRVQERTREIEVAEKVLRELNETLEQRVLERTAELQAANADLADSRRAAINLLEDAFDARRQAEESTVAQRESEEKLSLALRAADMGVWRLDLGEQKRYFDDQVCRCLGIDPARFGGTAKEFLAAVHPDDHEGIRTALDRTISSGAPYEVEYRAVWPDGNIRHVAARGRLARDAAGQAQRVDGLVWDITERKRAEERLQASLHEKEVLLKEVHHRVKNNLQVISSLVGMQADGSRDETVREVLRDVTDRVRSMALVHEKLYQSESLANIDFAEYARSLLGYLWRAYGAAAEPVGLTLDLEPAALPVDTAVPCGLILNELAGNALKHAFRGRSAGEVTVSLHGNPDGNVRLRVKDNGVGFPPELDWRQANSLGLRLVQMLARQLRATVEMSSGEGTEFTVTFRLKAEGSLST